MYISHSVLVLLALSMRTIILISTLPIRTRRHAAHVVRANTGLLGHAPWRGGELWGVARDGAHRGMIPRATTDAAIELVITSQMAVGPAMEAACSRVNRQTAWRERGETGVRVVVGRAAKRRADGGRGAGECVGEVRVWKEG